MPTVAYLANQFPAAVEPYVGEEILELRRRGARVISGSIRRPDHSASIAANVTPQICLEPIHWMVLFRALALAVKRWKSTSELLGRILLQGNESLGRRLKALLHTWLGAYYAVLLQEREVDHIHVHHGYFGSWIGMVAARLLRITFSMTLHGSDLLLHGAYLDTKLSNCNFCLTISDYNRRHILQNFPGIDQKIVIVSRLGVDTPIDLPAAARTQASLGPGHRFTLLAAGRLHPVKNLPLLVHACARLRDLGFDFECLIAGEGPEQEHLKLLIRGNRLHDHITLLGHVARTEMDSLYRRADVFVLTSLSEGIPVVLMEAMANGTIVLAPAITGIPELVVAGKCGLLYEPGNLDDLVGNILLLQEKMRGEDKDSGEQLDRMRREARLQVFRNFNRQKNLTHFGDMFLQSVAPHDWSRSHEDPVLQQI